VWARGHRGPETREAICDDESFHSCALQCWGRPWPLVTTEDAISATFTMTATICAMTESTATKIGATSTTTAAICATTYGTATTGTPAMIGGTFDAMNVIYTTTGAIFVRTGETFIAITMISATTAKDEVSLPKQTGLGAAGRLLPPLGI
jgi:hypothetical protein